MKRKIKIIDQAFAHCEYSNNPLPPIQSSEWIEWDRSPIKPDETVFVTEYNLFHPILPEYKGKKIAWLLECRFLNGNIYEWITKNHHIFDYVITHDRKLVETLPNARWVPFGGCWIDKSDWGLHNKTKGVSIVASNKDYLPGHKMRHQIINLNREKIDLFGRGYKEIPNKIESLKDYQYQIVIENASVDGYFTEKLIDCFMTGTVPIYYGDPKIDSIFDETGMIIVYDLQGLDSIIKGIEDIDYEQFKKGIANNFEIAKDYILAENYIYTKIPELL